MRIIPNMVCMLQLTSWMKDAGMEVWVDVIGNVHGRINATKAAAPVLLMGSHYDTVINAGM